MNDFKTSIYFIEKCLDIAKATSDLKAEMQANHQLGVAYEAAKDTMASTGFNERHLELARQCADVDHENLACKELVRCCTGRL